MAKRKITIEIEVDSLTSYTSNDTAIKQFTNELQLEISKTINKKTRRWNIWNTKMVLAFVVIKTEQI